MLPTNSHEKNQNNVKPTGENLAYESRISDNYLPGSMRFFQLEAASQDEEYVPCQELPSNPIDYLKNVMMEAKNCPDVVVAKIDPKKIKQTKSSLSITNTFMEKPIMFCEFSPDENWVNSRVKQFCLAREEYQRHLAFLKSVKRQTKKRPKLPVYPLPSWDDEKNWRYLCLGNNKLTNCLEKEICLNSEDIVMENVSTDNVEGQVIDLSTLKVGYLPVLRILLRMEPKHISANLEYHSQWLKETGFTHHQGKWIYSLLTCLEKPLFPSVTSSLRDLVRQCVLLRSNMNTTDMDKINGLNLIICIIGKYFDQFDLLG